jgi:hypothetical protein
VGNIQKEKDLHGSTICTDTISWLNNFNRYDWLGKNFVVHFFITLTEMLGTENTLKEAKL